MRIDIDNLTLPEAEAVLLLKAEVRRLQSVIAASQPILTDEEREAAEFFCAMSWPTASLQCRARSATLRALLERTT